MKTIILAGGFGTRLSEETSIIPKPMIEIGGKPLLWHLMSFYAAQGFNDFTIALGFRGEVIRRYFLQYADLNSDLHIDLGRGTVARGSHVLEDWTVDLVDTGDGTMTGGRLGRLRDQVSGTFAFTYGDGLSNVDLARLVAFHRSHGKLATVTAVHPVSRFGLLRLADGGEVSAFAEKPSDREDLINGGFFILEPGVFDYIDGDETIWERGPCERLCADGQLMAYVHDGFWQCVDTLHELRLLRQLWDAGEAAWKLWD